MEMMKMNNASESSYLKLEEAEKELLENQNSTQIKRFRIAHYLPLHHPNSTSKSMFPSDEDDYPTSSSTYQPMFTSNEEEYPNESRGVEL
jgi:hypothetical protein